jgi:hypothetical protein
MKKSLGTLLTVVVCGFIAWRAVATWGYIGGALQPGGGGRVAEREPDIDAAEVTREMLVGRWFREQSPRGEDYILELNPDKGYRMVWFGKDGEPPHSRPEYGTWGVEDGWLFLCRPRGGEWFGRVVSRPANTLRLRQPKGAVVSLDRQESVEKPVPPTAAPQQMPAPIPPGLPVTELKSLPTTTPPLPTTGPK